MSYLPWIVFYSPWLLWDEVIRMNPFLVPLIEQSDKDVSTDAQGQ